MLQRLCVRFERLTEIGVVGEGPVVTIVSLFKRRESPAQTPTSPEPPTEPDPRAADAALAARVEPLMRQLEDDVMLTMRVIGYKAQRSKAMIGQTIGHVEEIGRASDDLADIAVAAKQATEALTQTMQRLDVATRAIERNAASADLFADEASRLTLELDGSTQRMNDAVQKITGVVQLIATIARRTNLLALNASIEAARAGPAGRGFAVIANEMKTLAEQVAHASGDVSAQTTNLQTAARATSDASGRIGHLLTRIEPVFAAVRGAVDAQVARSSEVAEHASQSDRFVSNVASRAASVKSAASEAMQACRGADDAGDDMGVSLERLTQRAMVFLRHSASGNRRGAERVPVHLASSFKLGGETIEASVLDLSAHGALLRAPADLKAPQNLSLKIAGLGSVFAQVVGVSELGAHLRFTSLEPAVSKRIVDAIEAAKRRYEPFIRRAQWAAGDVAQAFEHGVAHGEVLMEELITTEYTPIFGTNPIQYETPAIRFYQKTLPPIMEQHRQSADRPLFVMPSDRNAYLPVHHPEFSLPQRQGDTAWNDLNCRDRRLMDRWMTLIGARNKAPYHLRVYARHGREGQVVPILMISCPVFVNGELWGNVQSGFAIDTAPVS